MPIYLFNDLFAYTTIDISEQIFIAMEEKASIWRSVRDAGLNLRILIGLFVDDLLSAGEKCSSANVQR